MCEISRDQMCGKFQDIPSKVEVKLLYLASPVTQKKKHYANLDFEGNIYLI